MALHVALAQAHVHHAGESGAVAGGEGTLVEHHVVHHLGIDGRGEALQVLGVVERDAVEREQVLVLLAASYIDACLSVTCRLYARQPLQRLQHVRLTQQHGHLTYLLGTHGDGAHLRALDAEVVARAIDLHFAQVLRVLSQLYVQLRVTCQRYGLRLRGIAHVTEHQFQRPSAGQGDGIAPRGVGGGTRTAVGVIDRHANQGLTCGGIRHLPAQHHVLGTERKAEKQE